MTFLQIYAFVIMPVVVVAIGAGAAWLHMRDLRSRAHFLANKRR